MEYRVFGDEIVLRLDRGEEVMDSIREVCRAEGVRLARIQGLGAAMEADMGLFDVETKIFHTKTLTEPLEITSLTGSATMKDGEVYLHIHCTVCGADLQARGGHLNRAVISATGEIFISRIGGEVGRRFDETIGLNIFDFQEE